MPAVTLTHPLLLHFQIHVFTERTFVFELSIISSYFLTPRLQFPTSLYGLYTTQYNSDTPNTILAHLTQFPTFPAWKKSQGHERFFHPSLVLSYPGFYNDTMKQMHTSAGCSMEGDGNALWKQGREPDAPGCPALTARLPGTHGGAPRRNAGLAVGRSGTHGRLAASITS